MKKPLLAASLVAAVALPATAEAQGLGVAGRVGTLGLGGEVAVGLSDRVVLRGGVGVSPLDVDATFDDVDVTLMLPTLYNVGLDFYLNGAFRIGGGLLFKPDDPEVTGEFDAPQDIGGRTFTPQELGTLTGVIDSKGRAPYILVGFGKHTDIGIGLSVDLGFAVLGEPDVRLSASGGTFPDQVELQSRLDQEAADFEENMRTYLEIWPILSLGLRIGVGS